MNSYQQSSTYHSLKYHTSKHYTLKHLTLKHWTLKHLTSIYHTLNIYTTHSKFIKFIYFQPLIYPKTMNQFKNNLFLLQKDEERMEQLKRKYAICINEKYYKNYKKKLTGYILFCKEEYKDKTKSNNSTTVSAKWRKLSAEEKDFYKLFARKACEKKITRKTKLKRNNSKVKNNYSDNQFLFAYKNVKITNKLKYKTINTKTYIVDCFNNIITIDGEDIGYINGLGEVILNKNQSTELKNDSSQQSAAE